MADAAAPALRLEGEVATNLADAAALREAIRTALERLAREGLRGTVELRVTVDAAGAAKVQVVRAPDRASRARVERALRGLTSAARPAGAGPGVYRVVAKIG